MNLLLYGSLLFLIAWLIHAGLWRIAVPERQTKVIAWIFTGVLVLGSLLLFRYSGKIGVPGLRPPVNWVEYGRVWLFFLALTMAYIITYSAVEADSPSLLIVLKIADAGEKGLDKALLETELDHSLMIQPRLDDLITDKMARLENGRYRLESKGAALAKLFATYRGIMGLGKGG